MKELDQIHLTDDQLNEVYLWVDKIPLSRQKRNINRDFSDGTLTAEIIKYYHPKLVSLHNFPQAHSFKQKFTNWDTLNRKVLKRIRADITSEQIEYIVNLKPDFIEKFLYLLKPVVESFKY